MVMQRECGKGSLIPHKWVIKYYLDRHDKEYTKPATGPDDPQFEQLLAILRPCGDVRLYVADKQGYMNCIRSALVSPQGDLQLGIDRRNELSDS